MLSDELEGGLVSSWDVWPEEGSIVGTGKDRSCFRVEMQPLLVQVARPEGRWCEWGVGDGGPILHSNVELPQGWTQGLDCKESDRSKEVNESSAHVEA